jgi:hypothetical protein
MPTRNIALFDLDGSLADYTGQLKADLELLRSPDEPELGDNLWALEKLPHMDQRMRLIKAQPGWWRNLPTLADGMRVFNRAKELGFDNNVLTKGPKHHPRAWMEKVEWSRERLGFEIPVHITEDTAVDHGKGMVYGKLLYDDYPDYCRSWLEFRPRGLVIMPVTSYNKDFHHPQVVKWDGNNWDEVNRALELCFKRAHGEELKL